MQVILAAMGGGAPGTMTAECAGALAAAECVVGARRLLAALPAGCTARRVEAARPQEVLQAVLEARGYASLCVVAYSGDTGFYSGACGLLPLLAENGVAARVLPGISSVQLLAARLGRTGRSSPPTARRATRLRRCAAADRCFSSRAARSARPRCARSCAKRAWAGWP